MFIRIYPRSGSQSGCPSRALPRVMVQAPAQLTLTPLFTIYPPPNWGYVCD
jgi:hypothetical protein